MYLNNDILEEILVNIEDLQDKINFCKINRDFYNNNYKNIVKYKIKDFIYKDYLKFYKCLNLFTYEEKEIIYFIKHTLKYLNFQTIWISHICGTYDLRFIFELMCKIKKDDDLYKIHENFYNHFYPYLNRCIIPNNREISKTNVIDINHFSIFRKNFRACKKNIESTNYINLL